MRMYIHECKSLSIGYRPAQSSISHTMPRILAVQSHVIRGHVGNKSATWPLQLLGCDVDPLNTVQVSNHSGYPLIKGHRFNAQHFADLFDALKSNGHDADYDLILSGYMGLPEGVPTVAEGIRDILTRNAGKTLYLVDPVLGDNGKLYLPAEMIDMYKQHFLPMAFAMTPNQFEAELLSGVTIDSVESACEAADKLAQFNTQGKAPLVVITTLDTSDVASDSTLSLLVRAPAGQAYTVSYPRLHAHFTGTGDLFTALLAGTIAALGLHLAADGALVGKDEKVVDIVTAVARIVWAMQQVLACTDAYATSVIRPEDDRAAVLRKRELQLIHPTSREALIKMLTVVEDELESAKVVVKKVRS
ncbi:Ribokinase-like protein [Catenaria anguillulae PL171]|uniref:pyridoxal kinase n=1 Tax=Catenaria anguillulae PL171 TaxID=765915 RepID=A0A1Y2HQ63_9FUNG|nr:Ribokinase-like protein [Catenaria anguillulae PL171]